MAHGLDARAESQGREVFDDFGVQLERLTFDRAAVRGCEPVHLPEVINGPARQGTAERVGRFDRDQAIVGPFNFGKDRMQMPERPADLVHRRIAGDGKTRDVLRRSKPFVESEPGLACDVKATLGVDFQCF